MKSEKLELLLNKVVEYNKPGVAHYRGFLYKSNDKYFIKVVEVDEGDINVNDKEFLTDGDENFTTQSDKPKLMRVSLKSWHYRLVKFVLRSNAPTPKTMQNGCPYFWLLIFSLFAVSFVLLWKAIGFILMLFPNGLYWCLEKLATSWVMSVNDNEVYEIYWGGGHTKMPVTAKMFFKNKNKYNAEDEFINYFLLEKYNLDGKLNPEEYQKKRDELHIKWTKWREELAAARQKLSDSRYEREKERDRRLLERDRKQAKRKAEWDIKMKPMKDAFKAIGASISKAFTFDPSNLKNIIKRTKQVVGALVTLVLLAATYFVVNGLVYGLTAFIDISISHWYIYAGLAIGAAIVGIIYVLYILVVGWFQNIINKYQTGKKIWYIEPFIYLIWYPVKYVVLGIGLGFFYVILIPLKYIFYNFLWKIILVNIGKLLWKILCSLGRGLKNSTGVFGEYFGASYSDYCPGLEWVDTEEEE